MRADKWGRSRQLAPTCGKREHPMPPKKTRTPNFLLPTPHRTGRKREHRTPNFQRLTELVIKREHRTSNAELPTSNGRKSKSERKRLPAVPFASYVRRSAFDVERGASASELGKIQRSPNWHSRRQCSMFVLFFRCEVFVFILPM